MEDKKMRQISFTEKIRLLADNGIVTADEVTLVCAIIGYNDSSIDRIVNTVTEYATFREWYIEEEIE